MSAVGIAAVLDDALSADRLEVSKVRQPGSQLD
jgi:hypothetical protein